MSFLRRFIRYDGRIGRLRFLAYNLLLLLAGLICALLIALAVFLVGVPSGVPEDIVALHAEAIALPPTMVLILWLSTLVTARRLRDMGLRGENAIWIMAVFAATGSVNGPLSGPLAIERAVFGVIWLVLFLWLLFTPGKGRDGLAGDTVLPSA